MTMCGATYALLAPRDAVCSREVDDRGQHSDEPTGPAGRNGQPMTVPADRHYDAKLIASWPVA